MTPRPPRRRPHRVARECSACGQHLDGERVATLRGVSVHTRRAVYRRMPHKGARFADSSESNAAGSAR